MNDDLSLMNPETETVPPQYVEVAVDGALTGTTYGIFTYDLGDELEAAPDIGQVVWVPLRNKLVHGIVTGLHDAKPDFKTRSVNAFVEPRIVLNTLAFDVAMGWQEKR